MISRIISKDIIKKCSEKYDEIIIKGEMNDGYRTFISKVICLKVFPYNYVSESCTDKYIFLLQLHQLLSNKNLEKNR